MRVLIALLSAAVLLLIFAVIATLVQKNEITGIKIYSDRIRIYFRRTKLAAVYSFKLKLTSDGADEKQMTIKRLIPSGEKADIFFDRKVCGKVKAELSDIRAKAYGSFVGRRHKKKLFCEYESLSPISGIDAPSRQSGGGHDPVGMPEGVREFAHGDRLRDIHMKLSAKCGKYMIRERFGKDREETVTDREREKPPVTAVLPGLVYGSETTDSIGRCLRGGAAFLLWLWAAGEWVCRVPWYCFAFAAAFVALRAAGKLLPSLRGIPQTAAYLMILLSSAAALPKMGSQLGRIINAVSQAVLQRFGYLFPPMEAENGSIAAKCFFAAAAVWAVVKAAESERAAVRFTFSAFMLLPAVLFCDSGITLAAAVLAAVLMSVSIKGHRLQTAAAAIMAAFVSGVVFSSPASVRLSDNICQKLDNAIYGGEIVQPCGRVSEIAEPSGDTAALEVVMDEPEAVYLHGFLGYEYSDGSWQGADAEQLPLSQSELAALHEKGFTADSQPLLLLENAGAESHVQSVTVRRLGADGRYGYTENGAFMSGGGYPEYFLKLENTDRSEVCSFKAVKDLFGEAENFSDALKKADGSYLGGAQRLDTLYREKFTSIPARTESALKGLLSDDMPQNAAEAAAQVHKLLDGCEYDRNAPGQTAEDFLQITKCGNGCAFASAAVLALRYYGIPARYAEGYAVTKRAADLPDGSGIRLTADDFHAWAEYYVEGVGWLPFETVPEYRENMPQIKKRYAVSGAAASANTAGGYEHKSGSRIYDRLPDENEKRQPYNKTAVCGIIIFAAAAVLAVFAVRLETDPAYALSKCTRRLKLSCDTSGNYDTSHGCTDKQRERIENLERICLKKYYSQEKVGLSGGLAAYLCCLIRKRDRRSK